MNLNLLNSIFFAEILRSKQTNIGMYHTNAVRNNIKIKFMYTLRNESGLIT